MVLFFVHRGVQHTLLTGINQWGSRFSRRRPDHAAGCTGLHGASSRKQSWPDHTERMENKEFIKKVYLSSGEGPSRRGRPLGRWEDRVKVYLSERGVKGNGLERARRECVGRERWRSFCRGHLYLVPYSLYFNFCACLWDLLFLPLACWHWSLVPPLRLPMSFLYNLC